MSNSTWEYIQKHPKQTKRLLGINYEQLIKLIEQGKLIAKEKQQENEK
ncbi:MAG: IS5/IS1182 family transposase, partial [Moorea sp. SIO4A5]|nr:IS5/IS1182 family transposase [Moorena sp. SIO4A5]